MPDRQGCSSKYGSRAEVVLERVGVGVEQILDLLGSLGREGCVYLVGSLAAELGNAGSDIDLHVFEGNEPASAPSIFFEQNTVVDVQRFPVGAAKELVGEVDSAMAPLCGVRCSLLPSPPLHIQNRLSRWLTALPLEEEECGSLIPPGEDREKCLSVLVRSALEEVVVYAAIAEVFEAAEGSVGGVAWRRAGFHVLELLVRLKGETLRGPKWTWAQARRSGVRSVLLEQVERVRSESEFRDLLALSGLPDVAAGELTEFRVRDAESVTLDGEDLLLFDGRQLVRSGDGIREGIVSDVLGDMGAAYVVGVLEMGLWEIGVNQGRVNDRVLGQVVS